jgi:proteasome lid subunit RPN8/RPN11
MDSNAIIKATKTEFEEDASLVASRKALEQTLLRAAKTCQSEELEEEGGIIMANKDESEFRFIKLGNTNSGTPTAKVLWTADRNEYAKTILPMFHEGWRQYASFHTHPQFLPTPSSVDTTQLFPGFRTNYIYSRITASIVEYEYVSGDVNWIVSYSVAPEADEIIVLQENGIDYALKLADKILAKEEQKTSVNLENLVFSATEQK